MKTRFLFNSLNNLRGLTLISTLLLGMEAKAQSCLLHYDKPATFFEEALPIGNGTQGAMVYGGMDEERISLNDITLWTGEPDREVYSPDAHKAIQGIREALFNEDYRRADELQKAVQGHYTQNYQPLGTLTIRNTTATDTDLLAGYSRTLDISKAIATVQTASQMREYFASAPDSVIVIHLQALGGSKLNQRFGYHCQLANLQRANVSKENVAEMTIDGYAAWTSKPSYAGGGNSFQYDSNRSIHFRTLIRVLNKDGQVKVANNDELQLTDCTEAIVLIANVTSFNGNDKDPVKEGRNYKALVRNRIDQAVGKAYDELRQRHEADYTPFFNRVSIDFGTTDPAIQAKTTEEQRESPATMVVQLHQQHQRGRELLACRDRQPGRNAPGFAGLHLQTARDRHDDGQGILRCTRGLVSGPQYRHLGYDLSRGRAWRRPFMGKLEHGWRMD